MRKSFLHFYKMFNIYSLYERLDETEFAFELIDKLIRKMPEKKWLELAQRLSKAFCYKISAYILEQIEKTSEILFLLGYCSYMQKHFAEAIVYFEKVTEPRRTGAIAGMKKIMEKQLNHSIPLSDEDKKLLKVEIEEAFLNSNFSDAEKLIDEFNLYSKPDIDIITAKASLYYYYQDYEKALELVREGLLLDDKCFDLLYNAGYIHKIIGDNKSALKMFRLAAIHCNKPELTKEIEAVINELLIM